ncbi:MAG: hypothetical protein IIZ67_04170 [Bacilli bacterium]|nr:hypothetical protein [Bacilli bacterium]
MSKYNHVKNELELLQKITNLTSLILELYSEHKISEEVKNKLLAEVKK